MSKYRNIKIAIPEENREEIHKQVQEALFADGCEWHTSKNRFANLGKGEIYVNLTGKMSYSNNLDYFMSQQEKEISYKEILGIDPNEMPKLEAGKHIIVSESGEKYLYLSDELCVRFSGDRWHLFEGEGWDLLRGIKIKSVHSININEHESDCTAEGNNLIWTKEKTREQKLREIIANAQKELDAL